MFTWICPKCGAEVPPSYNDCPNCAATANPPAAPTASAPTEQRTPPPPPQPAPAVPSAAPPAAARPAAAVQPKAALPAWLVTILVAGVLVGVGAGAYFYLLPSSRAGAGGQQAAIGLLDPSSSDAAAKPHPFARVLSISGIRIFEDARKTPQVRFVLVNHSNADIPAISMNVQLKAQAGSGLNQVANFDVKVNGLGPYESRDFTASIQTKLRAYELPDWQFLKADFQITSPAE